jgi:SOS-response transcriptional repressor LexA
MIEPRPLTTRQQEVFDKIARFTRATGEPCSASYLARQLNMHHSTVQEHITTLFRKGWLLGPNPPARPRRWLSRRRSTPA